MGSGWDTGVVREADGGRVQGVGIDPIAGLIPSLIVNRCDIHGSAEGNERHSLEGRWRQPGEREREKKKGGMGLKLGVLESVQRLPENVTSGYRSYLSPLSMAGARFTNDPPWCLFQMALLRGPIRYLRTTVLILRMLCNPWVCSHLYYYVHLSFGGDLQHVVN